jgi:peptidoglycan/LPS O-acetylase OafA/YrhL
VRGVAIILVVVHHLCHIVPGFLRYFGGGYLGVDLFFVLSGFLITSLIIEENDRVGSVSLATFYIRRALRLFPAVAAALLVAVIIGSLFGFSFIEFTPLRFASILGYFTNWVRAYEAPDWWFLSHFWSLAIEEQFYLLWPAFLIGLLALPRKAALTIVATLATGSAALMIVLYLSGTNPQRIYAGSDTRAFQLLTGCLASMMVHGKCLPAWLSEKSRNALGSVSLVILAGAFVMARPELPVMYVAGYPVVTLCAALLILHVTLDRSAISRLLQSRILIWFGKRSYGLYVWHFPIFFLIAKLEMPWLALFAVALVVVACALSYRFIELPFLRMKSQYAGSVQRELPSLREKLPCFAENRSRLDLDIPAAVYNVDERVSRETEALTTDDLALIRRNTNII